MTGLVFAAPAAGIYLFSALRQWLAVTGRKPAAKQWVLTATTIAACLHAAGLSQSLLLESGLNLQLFQMGSLISLVVTILIIFSSWRKPVENLLIALLPMAAITVLLASVIDRQVPTPAVATSLVLHIILSILAFSMFVIASGQAILLTAQNKLLRDHKTRGLIQALPSLQTMDSLLFEMIWVGMILLSVAFVIGLPDIQDLMAQQLIHKVVFAAIGWLTFATLLIGRYQFGWRGVTASRWTIIGTCFLILSYFGSKFVLEFILNVG